ncbi:50S ribosomal protein L9 [Bacteroidota bacterium]
MEIILKQDFPSLGSRDDIIDVKDGYARNFLIPKGIAIAASESAKKMLEENKKQRAHKEEKLKEEAIELSKQLEGTSLTIGAKASTKGKIFGSVNTIQIAEALKENGYNIDRKNISIEENVKDIGKYKAQIRLHKEVEVEIDFEVVSE